MSEWSNKRIFGKRNLLTILTLWMSLLFVLPTPLVLAAQGPRASKSGQRAHAKAQTAKRPSSTYQRSVRTNRLKRRSKKLAEIAIAKQSYLFSKKRSKRTWAKRGGLYAGYAVFIPATAFLLMQATLAGAIFGSVSMFTGPLLFASPFVFMGPMVGAGILTIGLVHITMFTLEIALYGAIGGLALALTANLIRKAEINRAASEIRERYLGKEKARRAAQQKKDKGASPGPSSNQAYESDGWDGLVAD